jgi:hypothetical protein
MPWSSMKIILAGHGPRFELRMFSFAEFFQVSADPSKTIRTNVIGP